MIRMIRNNECPFCGEMNQIKNPVVATVEGKNMAGETNRDQDWRTWKCPDEFRAKDISRHFVIAPRRHTTYLGGLSHEDFVALWSLVRIAAKESSGETLSPSFNGESFDQGTVCGYLVVPSGTQRVEAIFKEQKVPNHPGQLKWTKSYGNWMCWQCRRTPAGIESVYTIVPSLESNTSVFDDMTDRDFSDLSTLVSFLTDAEIGLGLPGGAFIMGLPGAALVMRFGEIKRQAGSIRHLHCNVMTPGETGVVSATLAKNADKIAEKMKVLQIWEVMRLAIATGLATTEQQAFDLLSEPNKKILMSRK
jgi:hypothetical protein